MSERGGKLQAGGVGNVTTDSAVTYEIETEVRTCSVQHKSTEQVSNKNKTAIADLDAETRWWMPVTIGDFRVRALYDPGASRTVMGSIAVQIAAACGRKIEVYIGKGAKVADGRMTPIAGHVTLPFEVAGVKRDIKVAIMTELDADCYLGANFIRTFQTFHDPVKDQLQVKVAGKTINLEVAAVSSTEATTVASIGIADVLSEQAERLNRVLDEILPRKDGPLGCTTWIEHEIKVGDTKPIKQRHYPVSPKVEAEMYDQVNKMLEEGIIEPSTSGWSSPVVMVKKSDGRMRFCIDFRKVNSCTERDAYPLPFMDQILRKLKRAKYISTLDLSSAYHQIPLKEESRPITAFTVPGMGLFQFRRMPFGLSEAGATFQRLIEMVIGLEFEPYAYSYLDDIIIATEDFETHMEILKKVLGRIEEAGLTVNREKSKFCQAEVKYLGVIVSREGIRPCPEKVEAILKYPRPTNRKALKRFLGLASWYRKFLKNFATIAEPLTRLTSTRVCFKWEPEQQEAFEKILILLASAPTLSRPDFSQQFVLHTDASDTGIGACLTQTIDGEERVIEFFSRVLNPAQRNYSVTERECLAVVESIRKFRCYLEGYHFKVITDHCSLKYIRKLSNATGRLARWSLELQGYSFETEYRKGTLNVVPDALSRMYEEESPSVAAITYPDDKLDEWYVSKLKAVQRNPGKFLRWKVMGGRLYYYQPNDMVESTVGDEEAWKLVVPLYLRESIIRERHDEPLAGHLGREKTLKKVGQGYFWPGMYKDIEAYVRSCEICQMNKVEQRLPGGLMGKRVVTRPWQTVSGDILGPYTRNNDGHKYVLVLEDLFTRWVEVTPLRRACGDVIWLEIWENVILRWGQPEVFLSDQGTEFKNQYIDSRLKGLGIIHENSPVNNPESNGGVERYNRTVKTMIRCFIQENQKTWGEHLPELVAAYNRAVHSATKASPAMLNMLRQPVDCSVVEQGLAAEAIRRYEELALEERRGKETGAEELRRAAHVNMRAQQDRQAKYYNARHRDVVYQVGDLVWRKNKVLSNKAKGFTASLAPKYSGPYQIVERLGTNTYAIKDNYGNEIRPVAVQQLKPRIGRESSGSSSEEEQPPLEACGNPDVTARQDSEPVTSESLKTSEKADVACELDRQSEKDESTRIYVTDDQVKTVAAEPVKKRRGRPPGSKKAKRVEAVQSPLPRRTRAQRHLVG